MWGLVGKIEEVFVYRGFHMRTPSFEFLRIIIIIIIILESDTCTLIDMMYKFFLNLTV